MHQFDQLQCAVNGLVLGNEQRIIARKTSCSKQSIIEGFLRDEFGQAFNETPERMKLKYSEAQCKITKAVIVLY